MVKNVLIVDDDKEMIISLKEGLEKYSETFSVLMANDGQIALKVLEKNPVSLVVTDLKMPRMDGFTLLSSIMEHYPDIPVIIMTAYSTPKMERLAREGGAVGYIKKPFMIDDLARQIIATMRRESDGGTLHGVSSGMFLQLLEMEQKTCTIRLSDTSSGKQGVLFFMDGELLDARINGQQGVTAAYEIFSWDNVNLSIQNVCSQNEKRIEGDLQAILLEAMRLKDEVDQAGEPEIAGEDEVSEETARKETEPESPDFFESLRGKLEGEIGKKCGIEDIYRDRSWNDFLGRMIEMGSFFNAGQLKLGYIDRGEPNDFILLPDKETIAISIHSRCPRDRIIRILTDE